MRLHWRILLVTVLGFTNGFSQNSKYPQGYFMWPVGGQVGLAANFGELRTNHWHMGMDCRTEKRENLPVYAAADGYVAKVKIEPGGFGRAIYINHPNGMTTLYAHLNDFYPALENYIKEQQYKLQEWAVFLDIPPALFPVKKGSFIANSGNTGGSQGPHLHFEIRDTKTDKVLNPLLFGFPIRDNIPPDIIRLAVYDRCLSTYEQSPKYISLRKQNGIYAPVSGELTFNTDRISFAFTSFDRYSGSTNQNGIYKAEIYDNNSLNCSFVLDSISYDETRYMNAHIDYKTKSSGGPYLQHLSKLPGDRSGIYTGPGDGVISLEDEARHHVKIIVYDAHGNRSTIQMIVKAGETRNSDQSASSYGTKLFAPGFFNVFENEFVRFHLDEEMLYDSFRFRFNTINGNNGPVYLIHNTNVPLHKYFNLSVKKEVAAEDTAKYIIRRFAGTKEDFVKAAYNDGWFTGRFREFGNFELIKDTLSPVISPISVTRSRITFSITDNTKNLKNFRPSLNGKWIRFSNDKRRTFIYNIDEHCPPGKNTLTIYVEDLAGNKAERTIIFKR